MRHVSVEGRTMLGGRLLEPPPFETPNSVATLRALINCKGDWWYDELMRREDPSYVRERLSSLIGRFGSLRDARVLDIGSGSGSSSLLLLDLGATQVTGIEPDPAFVKLATSRAADEGRSSQVSFSAIADTTHLPFKDGAFDVVTFNAVLEHMPPPLRTPILREAYRCLKPGGLLIFTETPNRVFPYDGHTTRLPFITWMPLALAYPFAKLFSRGVPRGSTLDQYISEGLVGGSYFQIRRALPSAICLNARGGDAAWKTGRKKSGPLVRGVLAFVESGLNAVGLPLGAVMPMLDLAYRKPKGR
ncbi:MAG: class I SAM-dependent methyltransferase [Patescibacteria group bacterium]